MTTKTVGVAAAGTRTRVLPRPDRGTLVVVGLAIILLYLTGYPLVMLILGSFGVDGEILKGFTLQHYADVYGSARTYSLLLNSIVYSLGVGLLALSLGTGVAWVVERTNTPLRHLFFALALPFARAARATYPNEAELASFLGLFNATVTGAPPSTNDWLAAASTRTTSTPR